LNEGWERGGDSPGHRLVNSRKLIRLRPKLEELGEGDVTPPLQLIGAWLHVVDIFCEHIVGKSLPPEWLETWRHEVFTAKEKLTEPICYWQHRSGRSPEHLARSCRRHYDLTPGELLNRARVERVKLLLSTTDAKVITIAFDCGFTNLSNFHRHFLRETGTTPALWRCSATPTVPTMI